MRPHRARPASEIERVKWSIPGIGRVLVLRPTLGALRKLDRNWEALRPTDDVAQGWEWSSAANDHDLFLLRGEQNADLGIWRAVKPTITLDGAVCYRLDNFEIDPANRARGLGRFMLGVIAKRATELGASGLVLTATGEAARRFYAAAGGVERSASTKWAHDKSLLPFHFAQDKLVELRGRVDALQDDETGS